MKFKPEYLMYAFIATEIIGILSSSVEIIMTGLAILVIMFVLMKEQKKEEKTKTIASANTIFNYYEITKYHIGVDNLSCVGIKRLENEIIFLTRNTTNEDFKYKSIKFNELLEVKFNEDDLTVISTDRLSQVGGAVIGGAIAGGVGAIIGGSGGTQYNEKKIKKIELQFVIDSLDNPIYKVCFMNEDMYIDKYDKKYESKFEIANNWYKIFTVILKRNKKEHVMS